MKTKTNTLKTHGYLISSFCMIIIFFSLFSIRSFAKDGYYLDSYNGKRYETNEEKLELEQILRADGYICVSAWCTDDEEATNLFRDNVFFFGKDFVDDEAYKVYVSPVSYKSMMQDGADNMDTVIIDWRGFVEEDSGQEQEGDIFYNYTDNPKNLKAGDEGTGTLKLNSTVTSEILKKYENTEAVFIFKSYDTNKRFEIDLNSANGFSSVNTIAFGNYFVESIYLGDDCIPTYDVKDFTIYVGTVTINIDFTANWTGGGDVQTFEGEETLEETIQEDNSEPQISEDKTPTVEEASEAEIQETEGKKGVKPIFIILGCAGVGLVILILLIGLALKKK